MNSHNTANANPCRVSHAHGLAILRFRSPLLTESLFVFFLRVLEMFHFPRSPTPIYSDVGDTTSLVPGFHSDILGSTLGLTAPRGLSQPPYVLHRLPVPRHPPCALKHLQTQNQLIQKKLHNKTPHHNHHPKGRHSCCGSLMLATTIHKSNTTPHHQSEATTLLSNRSPRTTGLLSQSPIVCLAVFFAPHPNPQQRIQLIDRRHACCAPDPAHYRQRVPTRLTPHQ